MNNHLLSLFIIIGTSPTLHRPVSVYLVNSGIYYFKLLIYVNYFYTRKHKKYQLLNNNIQLIYNNNICKANASSEICSRTNL